MSNNFENLHNLEPPTETKVTIEPELYSKLVLYRDFISHSYLSEADLMLDYGLSEVTTDGLANIAIRAFLEGFSDEFSGDSTE